jgi:L-ribulokinase
MQVKEGYVIGVDFGSDSVRAIVLDVTNGKTLGEGQSGYPRWLAGKYQDPEKRLFRQHPLDYLEAFKWSVNLALDQAGEEVRKHIVSIALDTTGSTPCPVNKEGLPLALLPEFGENVEAMFHLWKDHTAIEEAEEVNQALSDFNGIDYTKYQGTYCSEWYWAKILRTIRVDENVKKAAFSWIEHCDWIPAILSGNTNPLTMYRCACAAGHKALWHSEWNGLPDRRCFEQIDPYLGNIYDTYATVPLPADHKVGVITSEWAQALGVPNDVVIGGSSIDAHAGAVGAGIRKNVTVINVGTSTVDMLVEDAINLVGKNITHACGQAEDSILPGYVGIETSQAAFGDIYAWLNNLLMWPLENIVMKSSAISRGEKGRICLQTEERMLDELAKQAEKLSVEDALVALDWFNGRRYPNTNEMLRSAICGLTLGTDAPSIYQALVMATVFGQKRILDSLTVEGVYIDEIIAVGGIAQKSSYIMQMMADVLGCPIKVSKSTQACARGSAIYAAVSCGTYKTILDAQEKLCESFIKTYTPNPSKLDIYAVAYEKYCDLGTFMEQF